MKSPVKSSTGSGVFGFTLLELAVATALIALMAAAVATLAGRGLTVWRKAEGELSQRFVVERSFQRLGEELRNSVALLESPFEGGNEQVSFATQTDPTHLAWVRYLKVDQGSTSALVRQSQPFPPDSKASPATKTVVQGVKSFRLEYGAVTEAGGKKTVTWTEIWQVPENEKAGKVPNLIRARIEAEDSRGEVREGVRLFWIPHGEFPSSPGG